MKTNRKILICTIILFTFIAACKPQPDVASLEGPPASNAEPDPPLLPAEEPPAEEPPPARTSDEIFGSVADGTIPVIISHGGAPCDIDAVVYFTEHPQVDLIGMVLSRGEFHPENAVDDWPRFVLDVLGSQGTQFGLGSNAAMDANPHDFPDSWRPGADNFWNLPLPTGTTEFEMHDGHQLIIDLVNSSPEKVTIIAMASMIDLALALQDDPGIIDNIAHVVIMGGAFTVVGNLNDAPEPSTNISAEWNMYIDATAAKYVFDSGVPVSIVPLDAIQYFVTKRDIARISAINDPQVQYVEDNWKAQMSWGSNAFLIWDTITAVAVTNPEIFHWVVDGVDVITEPGDYLGQTVPLNDGTQHIRYAPSADYQAIMGMLYNTYAGNDAFAQSMVDDPITSLEGRWEGDTAAFHIVFDLAPECKLGMICGTFEIPNFSLSGDITIVELSGSKYEIKAINLSTGFHSTAAYEYLQVLPDGTLQYFTQGQDGSISEAVLVKQ